MDNGVSYTSTKPLEEFEINKKNKPSDLISRLSELRSQYNCFDESERDAYHTMSEAIEALKEHEKDGDVISRQDVLNLIEHYNSDALGTVFIDWKHGKKFEDEIKSLPSAHKTGKWAYKTTDAYIQRTCSACGWSERMYHRNRNQDGLIRNYCPNCGARMECEEE